MVMRRDAATPLAIRNNIPLGLGPGVGGLLQRGEEERERGREDGKKRGKQKERKRRRETERKRDREEERQRDIEAEIDELCVVTIHMCKL